MESATPATHRLTGAADKLNRRRGNRHRLSIPATLVVPGESPVAVTVTELSVGGVGIQAKSGLKLDAVYSLNSFDTLIPPGMNVKIVSQRPAADGGFEIGAKAV
jgi:hypothetical protein